MSTVWPAHHTPERLIRSRSFRLPGFQRQLCYSVLPSEKTAQTFTLVEVDLSAGRSLSVKKTLYRAIVESLQINWCVFWLLLPESVRMVGGERLTIWPA